MTAPTPPAIPTELLLAAYRAGIFPMADARDDPELFWIEPKRRAILPLDGFICSHSLARTLRRGRFRVTCNAAFGALLEACAAPRATESGETWISHRIEESYRALHRAGHAHSIECWQVGEDGKPHLVGGLYGVGFERVFCGESMFSRSSDASKVALAWTVAALRLGGAELLDCQFLTPHLASLGAVEISQQHYLDRLTHALRPAQNNQWPQNQWPENQWPKNQCGESASPASASPGPGGAATGAGSSAALSLPAAFKALEKAAASAGFSSSPGNFIAQSLTQTS